MVLDPTLPLITTDGERLRSALVNLLTNARHALEAQAGLASVRAAGSEADGADLEVRTEPRPGGRVVIVIRDRGLGIEPENLPRIWEPYFTTRRGGSGLGLAIVRNVIEGLGGTVAMDSRLSAGTTESQGPI